MRFMSLLLHKYEIFRHRETFQNYKHERLQLLFISLIVLRLHEKENWFMNEFIV